MRYTRPAKYISLALIAILLIGGLGTYAALRASLPQLEGMVKVDGLTGPAAIERDAMGTPTIKAGSRRDLAYATGYAHAQDRYFQMDLMRRAAAGELAELLGEPVIDTDKRFRVHAFRRVAQEVVQQAGESEREILEAYTAGVNFALTHARARPWEYLLLRTQPAVWKVEDSVLVAFSMYLNLNDS